MVACGGVFRSSDIAAVHLNFYIMAKGNPFLEAMLIPLISELAKNGSDVLFQKMVDKDKENAAIVFAALMKSIKDVSAKNGIKFGR